MRPTPLIVALIPFLLFSSHIFAANRYWVSASASNWNNTANWSTTSGGTGGATVPGSGDSVIFNNSKNGNCTLDMAPTVAGIIVSGYTGTFNMAGYNFTSSGSSSCTFSSGTITNTSGTSATFKLTCTGTVKFSGTAFGTSLTRRL